MSTNSEMRDDRIGHASDVEKYASIVSSKMMLELKTVLDKMIDNIASADDLSKDRLTSLMSDVQRVYDEGIAGIKVSLEQEMAAQASYEAEKAYKDLSSGAPASTNLSMASDSLVWTAIMETPVDRGYIFDEILKNFEANTLGRITAAIRQSVIEGDSIQTLVEKLRGTYGKGGILETERDEQGRIVTIIPSANGEFVSIYKSIDRIARTAVLHVMNTAAAVTYHSNAEVLEGITSLATLDEVTCEECGALDGTVWPIGDSHPVPPYHYNCRCTISPVVKSWRDLGYSDDELTDAEKEALDGQPSGKISYEEWLGKQSVEKQNDALGPGRAELFRSGMALEDMSDKGRRLTLEELRAKK